MNTRDPQPDPPPTRLPEREGFEQSGIRARKHWLHPLSAAVILILDWVFFGVEAATLELGLVVSCVAAFLATSVGVFCVQRWKCNDSPHAATGKALFGGLVAGLPTSIGGTVLGALVLGLAGLPRRKRPPPV